MKKIYKVSLIVVPIVLVVVAGYWFIAPNYKNYVSNTRIVGNNLSNRIYASTDSLRMAKDIKDYTEQAAAIIIGEFTQKGESEWSKDHVWIYTPYYFKVSEVLKGGIKVGAEVKIILDGGELDGQVQTSGDEMKFVRGEKNLLYLGINENGDFTSWAGDWGQFPIDGNGMVKNFDGKTVSLSDFKKEIAKYIK